MHIRFVTVRLIAREGKWHGHWQFQHGSDSGCAQRTLQSSLKLSLVALFCGICCSCCAGLKLLKSLHECLILFDTLCKIVHVMFAWIRSSRTSRLFMSCWRTLEPSAIAEERGQRKLWKWRPVQPVPSNFCGLMLRLLRVNAKSWNVTLSQLHFNQGANIWPYLRHISTMTCDDMLKSWAQTCTVQTCRTAMAACSWCCWGGPATDFAGVCCRNRKVIYLIYDVIQNNARSMWWWWWWWWLWCDIDVNMFVYMSMLICREETICESIYTCTILYYIQCSQSLDAAGLMFRMGENHDTKQTQLCRWRWQQNGNRIFHHGAKDA